MIKSPFRSDRIFIFCIALLIAVVLVALIYRGCASDPVGQIGTIAESKADSARIASDAAGEWKRRVLVYEDSIETINNENEWLEASARAAHTRADELERRADALGAVAEELYTALGEGSTAADTAAAFRGCTDARIGLLTALDACSRARDSLWTYTHGLEAEVVLHEAKDIVQDSAYDLQFMAFTGMEEAFDLRTIQVAGLQRENRSLTLQRYLYAAGALAVGYGVGKLTQ